MSAEEVTKLIQELETLTRHLIDNLSNTDEEGFEQFTSKRQDIVEQMEKNRTAMSENHKQQIGEILKCDPFILERMQALKDEAGNWMERRTSIRVQQNAYLQPYSHDSYFIDHRK
ncbi:hypothetical protein [Paenibacillus sp. DMB20]|uniref:hypothetical protein n=1 Tax=Paenibacillus sp. DMB20 TaxID=1642570 RepID=UPI000627F4F9|nr:hypothetical protein [Paenibacillus sp. DMB20]KKO54969.1 hypothetical protein XI25_03245 [Paenibacillus sp. DMB20]